MGGGRCGEEARTSQPSSRPLCPDSSYNTEPFGVGKEQELRKQEVYNPKATRPFLGSSTLAAKVPR